MCGIVELCYLQVVTSYTYQLPFDNMIHHFGFYLLRRPIKSIDHLYTFHQQLVTHSFDSALRSWYQENALVREAIYIASPSLYERFSQWLAGEKISESDQLQLTLYKYLIRMSTRCTPYGLFSGCVVGHIGQITAIRANEEDQLYKHTRLDIECIIALKDWLIEQPYIREQLQLFPNSSLYTIGENFRYVEEHRDQEQRNYFISSIESNDYITLIFNQASKGTTLPELTQILVDEGIDLQESYGFIQELIDNKILVFDIEPTITGANYLDILIEKLSCLKSTEKLVDHLESLRQLLCREENRVEMYKELRERIYSIGVPAIKKDIVQVDTFFSNTENQIGEKVIYRIQQQISKLFALHEPKVKPDMDEFKRRFRDRYEDEEVPFTLALDHEIGIGYGSGSSLGTSYTPMIDDLSLPSAQPAEQTHANGWWQNFIFEKYIGTLHHNAKEIELTDKDLSYIATQKSADMKREGYLSNNRPFPYSFYIFGNLLAKSPEAVDHGEFMFNLLACTGPSAINILSRFHEGDKELKEQLKQCVAKEEEHSPDVIFAEIVHCPDSRAGNIMTRPTLHQYEIPYMGKASVSDGFQIPVQDLMISLRDGQVLLRSRRLNKRIIPRLSNAHNYSTGLPIYRFLCDLQHQDAQLNINWDWNLLQKQACLPRVRYQNMIISRASWMLRTEDFNNLNVSQLKEKLLTMGLPDKFVIASGDNELLIDLNITNSLEILLQRIKKNEITRVLEFLATPDHCLLKHNDLSFTNELVIPFRNEAVVPIPGFSVVTSQLPQRRFSVGSEWLYIKIYTGEKSSDTILVQDLYPIINKMLEDNNVDKFFFVRYKDPEPHLRLRFHRNHDLEFFHQVIRVIENVLHHHVQAGVIHKVQVDSYHRELERYGMERIKLCELIFHADSMNTLKFLYNAGDACDENMRFSYAANRINNLLVNAGFSLADRFELMDKLKERFFNEFNGNSNLRKQLSAKYRNFKPFMDQSMAAPPNETVVPLITSLVESLPDKQQLFSILSSLIHMTVNRIFPSKQRAYELIIYHCLAKWYDSARVVRGVG